MPKKNPRPIVVCGDVAYIELTKGYVAIIDADDVSRVDMFCFHACPRANTIYAKCSKGPNGNSTTLHQIINQTPQGMVTDHIDRNGLNNRKSNLRSVDHIQNVWNSGASKNSKSKLKGVHYRAKEGKWRAVITREKKQYDLGLFDNPVDAHKAYLEKEKEILAGGVL